MTVHCHAWTCLSIVTYECKSPAKRFPPKTVNEKKFLSTQSLPFVLTKNQRLQHGPLTTLNLFLLTFFQHCVSKSADVLSLFLKVQTNDMIAIHQGDSTVTVHPLTMRRFIQDLGLANRRATQPKPEKIRIDKLFYQPEKLYTEALLEVLSKSIAEEINTTLKNECMACYHPALQVHSCYLNNPRGKVDRNFDNSLQLVDLWLANEVTFEKNKIRVAVKYKDLYLTINAFRLIDKYIFH